MAATRCTSADRVNVHSSDSRTSGAACAVAGTAATATRTAAPRFHRIGPASLSAGMRWPRPVGTTTRAPRRSEIGVFWTGAEEAWR